MVVTEVKGCDGGEGMVGGKKEDGMELKEI